MKVRIAYTVEIDERLWAERYRGVPGTMREQVNESFGVGLARHTIPVRHGIARIIEEDE